MPLINGLQSHQIPGSHYGFSGARLNTLGASEYTLAVLACDVSGSVTPFLQEIEQCIRRVVGACHHAPRADNLMLRVTAFDEELHEVHGFKPLTDCALDDYDGCLTAGGLTALYDAAHNAVASVRGYGQKLTTNGFGANGIVFVVTDGMDNASTEPARRVKEALRQAVQGEEVESLISVLVGVNVQNDEVKNYLKALSNEAGFTAYIPLEDASESTLAKLADFFSRSIALQSRHLGAGGVASVASSLTF